MSTLAQLGAKVQDALEEMRLGTAGLGTNFFNFWDVTYEIYPLLAEGMYLASTLSGEPIVQASVPVNLAANSTLQTMPFGAFILLRMNLGGVIPKTSVFDLDNSTPNWEIATGTVPQFWFPVGLGQFGIYPQLVANVQAQVSYIVLPVQDSRPYTGAENCPFQPEYDQGFVEYAVAACRLKEGGEVFEEVMFVYNEFLTKMKELGKFSSRKDSLRFTRGVGYPARFTDVEVR